MKKANGLMKFSFAIVCAIGILFSFCGSSVLAKDKRYVDYFLHLYAAELFRNQSFVLKKSWSYVSQTRLERVGMTFSCYKAMTMIQARKLVVDIANGIIDRVNSDSELRARHLINQPFTADRLRLEVKTDNIFSEGSDVASVRVILFNGSEIIYETYPKSSIYSGSPKIYKETFEDALMLLDDSVLLEQIDNPLRRPSCPTPWTGKVFSPESPIFASSGDRMKKMKVSGESFFQGVNLSLPKHLLVEDQELKLESPTKKQVLPGEMSSGFFQDQEAVSVQSNVLKENDLHPDKVVFIASTSPFELDKAPVFQMIPSSFSVKEEPILDAALNKAPSYLKYERLAENGVSFQEEPILTPSGQFVAFDFKDSLSGPSYSPLFARVDVPQNALFQDGNYSSLKYEKLEENGVSFQEEPRITPSSEWVAFDFKDSLSGPSCATSVARFAMTQSSLPQNGACSDARWIEKCSLLDLEGGKSSLTYTMLSSSALPKSQEKRDNGKASLMASTSFPGSDNKSPSQISSLLVTNALVGRSFAQPVFSTIHDESSSFKEPSPLLAVRDDTVSQGPQSAFYAKNGGNEKVLVAQKNLVSTARKTQQLASRSSSIDASGCFFEKPTKHVSSVGAFVAQTTPMNAASERLCFNETPSFQKKPLSIDTMIAYSPENTLDPISSLAPEKVCEAAPLVPVEEQAPEVVVAPELEQPSESIPAPVLEKVCEAAPIVSTEEQAPEVVVAPEQEQPLEIIRTPEPEKISEVSPIVPVDEKMLQAQQAQHTALMKRSVRSFVAKSASEVLIQPHEGQIAKSGNEIIANAEEEKTEAE